MLDAFIAQKNTVIFTGDHGIRLPASTDIEYAGGLFGRDGLTVALDNLPFTPEIARRTLILFAEKQGVRWDMPDGKHIDTEEQPGRILHEERSDSLEFLHSIFADEQEFQTFVARSNLKSQRLIEQWGKTYYGSIDATPKFLLLAREYLQLLPDDKQSEFLTYTYVGRDNQPHTIYESLVAAADWVNMNASYGANMNPYGDQQHEKIDRPLLRFQRLNGMGIENQDMMDSKESFIYPDGTWADHTAPIASTGSQGQAYDGLLFAASLLKTVEGSPEAQHKAQEWETTAKAIQKNTLALWMPEENYFAMGEDRKGAIPTLCANVSELLASSIFDNVSIEEKQKYVSGITRMLFSPEFLTEVGIRTRALKHRDALLTDLNGVPTNFSDYHGTDAVWMEKLRWLIRGLAKQGLHKLADQMRMMLLDAVNVEGSFTEFFWVTPDGKPIYNHKKDITENDDPNNLNVTSLSETNQAWTISAAFASEKELADFHQIEIQTDSWQRDLEEEIISDMQVRHLYRQQPLNGAEIAAARTKYVEPPAYINTIKGKRVQEALHARWGRTA